MIMQSCVWMGTGPAKESRDRHIPKQDSSSIINNQQESNVWNLVIALDSIAAAKVAILNVFVALICSPAWGCAPAQSRNSRDGPVLKQDSN